VLSARKAVIFQQIDGTAQVGAGSAILNYLALPGGFDVLRSTHQGSPRLADRLLGSCRRLNATYTHIIPPRGLEAWISLCV